MAEHWIQGAIKRPGAFKAKAQRAGETTRQFAREHAPDSGRTGRQARLAQTLMKMAEGGVVDSTGAQKGSWGRLYDMLFGRKALQQASQTGNPPPAAPPQPTQDVSAIRQAAEQAAERMRKAKEENKGVTPKAFSHGGMVKPYGGYGR